MDGAENSELRKSKTWKLKIKSPRKQALAFL